YSNQIYGINPINGNNPKKCLETFHMFYMFVSNPSHLERGRRLAIRRSVRGIGPGPKQKGTGHGKGGPAIPQTRASPAEGGRSNVLDRTYEPVVGEGVQ